jgi:phosphoadenosine phosphosulfate reductase
MRRTPLETRIDHAARLLTGLLAAHGPGRVAVAWTGGKDSTVALDLWRAALAGRTEPPVVVSVDTGCKFPEVVAFRDEWADRWGLDLHVARPEMDPATYPVAVDPLACCRDLKVEPLHRMIEHLGLAALITGLRADEHPDRAGRSPLEQRTTSDGHRYLQVNAVLGFTEMDVWAYLTSRGLPFCSLYGEGYRSLGCVPCTARSGEGERSGRSAAKEARLAELRSLGYF